MESRSVFSHGKLILMGEYAVMHGADAICLPLNTGQRFMSSPSDDGKIHWQWSYKDILMAGFFADAETLTQTSEVTGNVFWPIDLINLIRKSNPDFLKNGARLEFHNLFPPRWGLGTSSATISSLCRLAGVDPFKINQDLTGGSGADIATAISDKWILYRKGITPQIWTIPVNYRFAENTWFVYSGKKQQTATHISKVSTLFEREPGSWAPVNEFVYRFIAATTLPELMKIVYDHELFIAEATGLLSIRYRFPDFPGTIKSLGAWGGDFFMVLSQQNDEFVKNYFNQKGFRDVFSWQQLTENDVF